MKHDQKGRTAGHSAGNSNSGSKKTKGCGEKAGKNCPDQGGSC